MKNRVLSLVVVLSTWHISAICFGQLVQPKDFAYEVLGDDLGPQNVVKVSDIDGDGWDDICSEKDKQSSTTQSVLSIRWGGEQPFAESISIPVGAPSRSEARYDLEDFDFDGDLDILVTTEQSAVHFIENTGGRDGFVVHTLQHEDENKFVGAVVLTKSSSARTSDAVVFQSVLPSSFEVTVFRKISGEWKSVSTLEYDSGGNTPYTHAASAMEHDGDELSEVSLILNNYDGDGNDKIEVCDISHSGQVSSVASFPVRHGPRAQWVDLNGDGYDEHIWAYREGIAIRDGFDTSSWVSIDNEGFPYIDREHVIDINQDGLPDLLFAYRDGAAVYIQGQDGEFHPRHLQDVYYRQDSVVLDVDSDGLADIGFCASGRVLVNYAVGYYRYTSDRYLQDFPNGVSASGLIPFDFDQDGINEVLLSQLPEDAVEDVFIYDWDVEAETYRRDDEARPFGISGSGTFSIHDITKSGIEQIVQINTDGITTYEHIGPWLFFPRESDTKYRYGLRPVVQWGDYTADGLPDLALVDYDKRVFYLLAGNGAGLFSDAGEVLLPTNPRFAVGPSASTDFQADFFAWQNTTSDIVIYRWREGGPLKPIAVVPFSGGTVRGMLACDYNDDGQRDVLITTSSGLFVISEDDNDRYSDPVMLSDLYLSSRVGEFMDYDGDGDMDFVGVADTYRITVIDDLDNIETASQIFHGAEPGSRFFDHDGDTDMDIVTLRLGELYVIRSQRITNCRMDIDSDGVIGQFELSRLLTSWGKGTLAGNDHNQNGSVDSQDIALLLAAWGTCE